MELQVQKFSDDIKNIIDDNFKWEIIADEKDGIVFTEGPIWDNKTNSLIFSDIAGNKMYEWNEEEGLKVFVEYSYKGNGNSFWVNDKIITCEHATSRVVARNRKGDDYTVLCSHYKGLELNSPNDIVSKKDGTIYFTDPIFGRNYSINGVGRKVQQLFRGVYRYRDGELKAVCIDMENPNGLCFTKDEKQLFVNDSSRDEIRLFDVDENGDLKNSKVWVVTEGEGVGHPDGMKLDSEERLYCCAQGGVHIFSKEGKLIGKIIFPVQTANLSFGGKNNDELFVCATNRVYRLFVKSKGL